MADRIEKTKPIVDKNQRNVEEIIIHQKTENKY